MINRFAQWGGMPQQNFDFQPRQPASQGMWQAQNNAQTLPDVWNPYPGHRMQNIPQPTSPTMPMGYMQHTRGQPRQPASQGMWQAQNNAQTLPDVWNPYPGHRMQNIPQPTSPTMPMGYMQHTRGQPRQPASLAAVLGGNQPQAMPALSKPQFQPTQNPSTQQAQTYANTLQNLLQGGYNPGF